MVVIPPGWFIMGSSPKEKGCRDNERPQHRVRVPRFAIGRHAVTFEEYERYCEASGIEAPSDQGWGRGRRPVINVSCRDAKAYCAWLSGETGRSYRLPSEAEWEYACRAGTVTRYSWGDAFDAKLANAARMVGRTTTVGSYPANPWKLFDMHGNVWEWCEDAWHESYASAPADGSAWLEVGARPRMLRGGSWSQEQIRARSAHRSGNDADYRGSIVGFRVVCSSSI